MSSKIFAVVVLSLSTTAFACTTAQSRPANLTQADGLQGCALGVPRAVAVAEDTPDGIAVDFRSDDRSEELRERANDAAAQHGPGQRLGRGHDGKHGQGGDHGLQVLQMPAARSVANDIEGGARIRFVAVDAAETDVLRSKVRERVAAMNAESCVH